MSIQIKAKNFDPKVYNLVSQGKTYEIASVRSVGGCNLLFTLRPGYLRPSGKSYFHFFDDSLINVVERRDRLTTAYVLALQWLESEGYKLIDQGVYSKQPELDEPLQVQVVGHEMTGNAFIRVVDDGNWADLPEVECYSIEQFVAVARNFEYLSKNKES